MRTCTAAIYIAQNTRKIATMTVWATNLHESILPIHQDAKVVSQEVVRVSMLQIGEGLVRYVIEGEVASVVVTLPPLVIHFPFIQ